jgi:hypothetical protein
MISRIIYIYCTNSNKKIFQLSIIFFSLVHVKVICELLYRMLERKSYSKLYFTHRWVLSPISELNNIGLWCGKYRNVVIKVLESLECCVCRYRTELLGESDKYLALERFGPITMIFVWKVLKVFLLYTYNKNLWYII